MQHAVILREAYVLKKGLFGLLLLLFLSFPKFMLRHARQIGYLRFEPLYFGHQLCFPLAFRFRLEGQKQRVSIESVLDARTTHLKKFYQMIFCCGA